MIQFCIMDFLKCSLFCFLSEQSRMSQHPHRMPQMRMIAFLSLSLLFSSLPLGSLSLLLADFRPLLFLVALLHLFRHQEVRCYLELLHYTFPLFSFYSLSTTSPHHILPLHAMQHYITCVYCRSACRESFNNFAPGLADMMELMEREVDPHVTEEMRDKSRAFLLSDERYGAM